MSKKTDQTVQWENPPPRSIHNREGKYDAFFDALRERAATEPDPDKHWARFPGKTTSSAATSINNGKYANTSKGEFEATFRTLADNSQGVWVRLRPAAAKPLEFKSKPKAKKATARKKK